MNQFLGSLKHDLFDRRMLPILVLLGVALVGAVAYAAIGGGGSASSTPPVSPLTPPTPASAISVTPASSAGPQPVAETTSGIAHRSAGAARNPFAPLPGSKAVAEASPKGATPSTPTEPSSPAGSSTPSPSSPQPEATPTPEAKKAPSKPKKQTVYAVSALFGVAAAGVPAPAPGLTPYDKLKRQQPLPSTNQPLVVFRGVTAGGKSATFTVVGEAILRGQGACQPEASQCLAIDLQPGQYEELEYVPPEGAPVVYQLQVVSIDSTKASAAAARAAFGQESKAGIQFLRTAGLDALPGMRYSPDKGVLVFAHHPAFVARAHAAGWGASLRG
ncbi:MAG: hypothetical protein ACYDHT_09280 [Solirubrobacteraceae bacterium]